MTHDALQTWAKTYCKRRAMCNALQIQGSTETCCCGTCEDSVPLDVAWSGMSGYTSHAWGMPAACQ